MFKKRWFRCFFLLLCLWNDSLMIWPRFDERFTLNSNEALIQKFHPRIEQCSVQNFNAHSSTSCISGYNNSRQLCYWWKNQIDHIGPKHPCNFPTNEIEKSPSVNRNSELCIEKRSIPTKPEFLPLGLLTPNFLTSSMFMCNHCSLRCKSNMQ